MALSGFTRHARRFEEIARILIKYGLAEWMGNALPTAVSSRLASTDGQPLTEVRREERIRLALSELGTTFIKLGQVLSTRPDLVGPELADELSHLQAASPADPPDVVRSRIESELGAPLESRFAELDLDPIASGSVGQVHDARLPGGERVVVKVQHPDIEERIHTDLDILDSLAELAETRSTELRLLAPRAVARQFRRRMLNELDFERERRNLERFRRQFARDGRVTFPAPIPALSTRRLLTMERIDGRSVRESEALRAAGHDLQALAARGAGVVLKMILGRGYYHADPHPGNVFVLEDGRICMQTVKELLSAAAGEEEGFRSGLVSVVQTFGDRANFHPHVHAVVSRGGWTDSGEWVPVPYVDERAAEELFRHKVLSLLRRRGLVSEERIKLLLSWRRSGFSVHNRVYAHPADGREFALHESLPGEPEAAAFCPRLEGGRLHAQGWT